MGGVNPMENNMKTCYMCGRAGTKQFSEFFTDQFGATYRCSWRPACQDRIDRQIRWGQWPGARHFRKSPADR